MMRGSLGIGSVSSARRIYRQMPLAAARDMSANLRCQHEALVKQVAIRIYNNIVARTKSAEVELAVILNRSNQPMIV